MPQTRFQRFTVSGFLVQWFHLICRNFPFAFLRSCFSFSPLRFLFVKMFGQENKVGHEIEKNYAVKHSVAYRSISLVAYISGWVGNSRKIWMGLRAGKRIFDKSYIDLLELITILQA